MELRPSQGYIGPNPLAHKALRSSLSTVLVILKMPTSGGVVFIASSWADEYKRIFKLFEVHLKE